MSALLTINSILVLFWYAEFTQSVLHFSAFINYATWPFGAAPCIHTYIIWNREVSLVWRSNKYVSMAKYMGTSMAIRITEVSLIQRPVIERFHCGRHIVKRKAAATNSTKYIMYMCTWRIQSCENWSYSKLPFTTLRAIYFLELINSDTFWYKLDTPCNLYTQIFILADISYYKYTSSLLQASSVTSLPEESSTQVKRFTNKIKHYCAKCSIRCNTYNNMYVDIAN